MTEADDQLRQMEWTLQLFIGKSLKEQDIRSLKETLKFDIPKADMERCCDFNDLWNELYGKGLIRLGNYDYLAHRFHTLELVQITTHIQQTHDLMRQITCTNVPGQYEKIVDGPTFYKQIEDLRKFKETVPDTTLDQFCHPNAAAAIAGERDVTLKLKDKFHLYVPKQSVESCIVVYCHFSFLSSPETENYLLEPQPEQNIIWYGVPITCGPTPHQFCHPVSLILGHCADLPPFERICCESLCIYMRRVEGHFEPLGIKPCIFDKTGFVTIQTGHFTTFCVGLDASKADCFPKIKLSILASVRKSTNGGILIDIIFVLDTEYMVQMACKNSLTMKMEASFNPSNRVTISVEPVDDLVLVLKDGSPGKTRTVNIPQHVIRNLAFKPLLLTKPIIPFRGKPRACEVFLSQQEPITDFVILSDSYEMDVLPRGECASDVSSEVASLDTDNADILASDSGISDQDQRAEDQSSFNRWSQFLAQSPGDILMLLSEDRSLMQELLKAPMEPDCINLVLAVLSKGFENENPVGETAHVLTSVLETEFIDRIIPKHIQHIEKETLMRQQEQFVKPIMDILNLCYQLLYTFPLRDNTRHIVGRCLTILKQSTRAPMSSSTSDRQITSRIRQLQNLLSMPFRYSGWNSKSTTRKYLEESQVYFSLLQGPFRHRLQLLLNEDPDDIVNILCNDMSVIMTDIVFPMREDLIRLYLAVFSKACQCSMSNQQLVHVLRNVLHTDLLDRVIPAFLQERSRGTRMSQQQEDRQSIKDILELCLQLLLLIPNEVVYRKVWKCFSATEATIESCHAFSTFIDKSIEFKVAEIHSRLGEHTTRDAFRDLVAGGEHVAGRRKVELGHRTVAAERESHSDILRVVSIPKPPPLYQSMMLPSGYFVDGSATVVSGCPSCIDAIDGILAPGNTRYGDTVRWRKLRELTDDAVDKDLKRLIPKSGTVGRRKVRELKDGEVDKDVKRRIPKSELSISEDERLMIFNAMGMSKGHWYKCPKGHPYVIGDSGSAIVESRCPECKATIGGRNCALAVGNTYAGDIITTNKVLDLKDGEVDKDVKKRIPKSELSISEDELLMIFKAMGLSQQQWYKCPNGHPYVIGESGSAMVESRCPDCNATIGGRNLTLAAGNTFAGDIITTNKALDLKDGEVDKDVKRRIPKSELSISEDELLMIFKAMGLSQQQWYKCPNGHPYVIGESGSAMVESRCPDCNATIGGRNFTLAAGNTFAGDIITTNKALDLKDGEVDKDVKRRIPKSELSISEDELLMIFKAMGLSQQQWYKCPNGHPYVIGESGSAMVESRCPDCNATIGGRNFTLAAGNTFAGHLCNW